MCTHRVALHAGLAQCIHEAACRSTDLEGMPDPNTPSLVDQPSVLTCNEVNEAEVERRTNLRRRRGKHNLAKGSGVGRSHLRPVQQAVAPGF